MQTLESRDSDAVVRELIKRSPKVSPDLINGTRLHNKNAGLDLGDENGRYERIRDQVAKTSKLSREEHLEAIVQAYSMFLLATRDEQFAGVFVSLYKESGLELTSRKCLLRVILELTIAYGDAKAQAASKLHSRDVAAVRYLIANKVLPQQVSDLAQAAGEGLDAWARGRAKKARLSVPNYTAKITIMIPGEKAATYKASIATIKMLKKVIRLTCEKENISVGPPE